MYPDHFAQSRFGPLEQVDYWLNVVVFGTAPFVVIEKRWEFLFQTFETVVISSNLFNNFAEIQRDGDMDISEGTSHFAYFFKDDVVGNGGEELKEEKKVKKHYFFFLTLRMSGKSLRPSPEAEALLRVLPEGLVEVLAPALILVGCCGSGAAAVLAPKSPHRLPVGLLNVTNGFQKLSGSGLIWAALRLASSYLAQASASALDSG
jgi:hypothetical protein